MRHSMLTLMQLAKSYYLVIPSRIDLSLISSQFSGLVDGHTHPIWSGDRVHEFAMKLAGMDYMKVPMPDLCII